jgi:hypothetical protein
MHPPGSLSGIVGLSQLTADGRYEMVAGEIASYYLTQETIPARKVYE